MTTGRRPPASRAILFVLGLAVVLTGVAPSATGRGAPTFSIRRNYAPGAGSQAIAIGDFDRDGSGDLVTANGAANTVSIFLNNGSGMFGLRVDYPVGSVPRSVAVGDLDGDGAPDIVAGNWSGASVSVLLNRGDGTFSNSERFPAGGPVRSVAVGDLNGDGEPDVATANGLANTVSVLLNKGNGMLGRSEEFPTGRTATSIALGDVDGDAKPDLATANERSNSVSVLMNRGDGTFRPRVDYRGATYGLPNSVAIADVTGDGSRDLVVANKWGPNVFELINRGDGTFGPRRASPYVRAQAFAVGDLNADGVPDLALAEEFGLEVLVGRRSGGWRPTLTLGHGIGGDRSADALGVAVGDLNRDGRPDIATTNVSVLLNQPGVCDVQGVAQTPLASARRKLRTANCNAHVLRRVRSRRPRGMVLAQRPNDRAVLPGGSAVELVVSAGR